MKIEKHYRATAPPQVESIGHGKWLVHWNIEEIGENRFAYNEVCLTHKPTKKEIASIKKK